MRCPVEIEIGKYLDRQDALHSLDYQARSVVLFEINRDQSVFFIWRPENFIGAFEFLEGQISKQIFGVLLENAFDQSIEIPEDWAHDFDWNEIENMKCSWRDSDLCDVGALFAAEIKRLAKIEEGFSCDYEELGRLVVQRLIDYCAPLAQDSITRELIG